MMDAVRGMLGSLTRDPLLPKGSDFFQGCPVGSGIPGWELQGAETEAKLGALSPLGHLP